MSYTPEAILNPVVTHDPPPNGESQPDARLRAFITPAASVAGLKLRPFSAGPLAQFQMVGHKFLQLTGTNAEVAKQLEAMPDVFDQVGQALFILGGEKREVIEAVYAGKDEFRRRAFEFYADLPIRDIQSAAVKLFSIMGDAAVGLNYDVRMEGAGSKPNPSIPAGSPATPPASPATPDGAST